MQETIPKNTSRIARVRKRLGYAMSLAWAASPRLLIRYSLLGMFNAIMPPVSDDGRVTELGTHEELLAAGNRYARLFELQARGYR